jgi:hypothetical protein
MSLFVKSVPKDATMEDLKSLHPDIVSVRSMPGRTYAFLIFSSEAACNKAHDIIANTPLKGAKLIVDYCGDKAEHKPARGSFCVDN